LKLAWLSASYSIRFVDKAYTNQANTRYYDSYRLDDFHIGLNLNISKHWRVSSSLKIDNVRDVDYVLMTHYPMPGRQWSFFTKIAFGLKE
jgi:outer membrane cobalamin receptor